MGGDASASMSYYMVVSLRSDHVPCHGYNIVEANLGQVGRAIYVQDIDSEAVLEAEIIWAEDAGRVGSWRAY